MRSPTVTTAIGTKAVVLFVTPTAISESCRSPFMPFPQMRQYSIHFNNEPISVSIPCVSGQCRCMRHSEWRQLWSVEVAVWQVSTVQSDRVVEVGPKVGCRIGSR